MDWMAKLNEFVQHERKMNIEMAESNETPVNDVTDDSSSLPEPLVSTISSSVNVSLVPKFTPSIEKCWLDDQGRLRCRGLPPEGIDRLELLLQLGATSDEIENHIHPINTPAQWERWVAMGRSVKNDKIITTG